MSSVERVLLELTHDECFELLRTQPVGRFAAAVPGEGPIVVPVNFIVDGDVIVFRSDMGTKIAALRHGPVSFQVDWIDWMHKTGWSVLARGVAYEATHFEVEHLDVNPWSSGDKRHWVRLVITEITGRRIEAHDFDWRHDDKGYL